MKETLRVLVALVVVIGLPMVVRAVEGMEDGGCQKHEKRSHQSPHGGQVVSAESRHLELVVHEGEIRLYLFSQSMTPLPVEGVRGTIEILVPGLENRRAEFTPGIDALEAKLDLVGVRKVIAVVTLNIDGKAQTARFSIDFRAHHRDE